MRAIIWGATKKRAYDKLEEIIEGYERWDINVKERRNSYFQQMVIFENEDQWIALKATENNRGRRCNVSYIDRNIDKLFIKLVIEPSTHTPPFQAFHYF